MTAAKRHRPPTAAQLTWLDDLQHGRKPAARFRGAYRQGGGHGAEWNVSWGLFRRGLISSSGALTDAGRDELAKQNERLNP